MNMDSRKVIDFLKSPTGKAVAVGILIILLSFYFDSDKKTTSSKNISLPQKTQKKRLVGNLVDFDGAEMKKEVELHETVPPEITEGPTPIAMTVPKPEVKQVVVRKPQPTTPQKYRKRVGLIELYSNSSRAKKSFTSDKYAPYGRLVKCELVNTIDTSNLTSPIIAIVSEDVEHNGKVIIPANTELHGLAAKSPMRDRVGTQTTWRFVWRSLDNNNGKELEVKGTALANTKSPDGEYWAIDDGSAGIPGLVIDNRDEQLLKALAAIAIKGAGQGLKNQTLTTVGDNSTAISYEDTANAILGNMFEESGDFIAQQILDTIKKQGYYVRCGAGTTFYLYVMQTIDMKDAKIAGNK